MGLKEEMQGEIKGMKEDLATVSKAFHELQTEKHNSTIKRYRIITALLLVLLILSNSLWLMYRMSLEKVTETTTTSETYTINQEAEGTNNSIINGGDIVNGKAND